MAYRTGQFAPALLVTGLLAVCAGPLAAQVTSNAAPTPEDALAAAACKWAHSGGQLAVALCRPGLTEEILAAAGSAACAGHVLCAAWIYDDATALPDPMPDTFEGLTQENVTSAVAVWVEEDELLITIAPED